MFTRIVFAGALFIASIAYLLSGSNTYKHTPYIQGRNKTVLFLTNENHGLCNVHLATAFALLENWPDIDIHYGSFAALESKVQKMSSFATANDRNVVFHELRGPSFIGAIARQGKTINNMMHPPASAGFASMIADMQMWVAPWEADDHVAIYDQIGALIDQLDPAVVVLDTFFRPSIDATRDKNRLHAFITPNSFVLNFLRFQPFSTMLWKYPA